LRAKTYRGSCLCGDVRFSFKGALDDAYFCHCIQCRKNYGMHGAFVGIDRDKLIIENPKSVRAYKSSKTTVRTFCKRCGSPIAWDRKGYKRIYVCMGLLEGKIAPPKIINLHTKNKGAYYEID
jgi:hypothetical protein